MQKLTTLVRDHKRRNLVLGGLGAIIIVGALGYHELHHAKAATLAARAPKGEQVTVASVDSLSPGNAPLEVLGKVESESDATILSQTSGEVTGLYHQLGDHVAAGETIAVMENSSQQAAVAQAQGAYDAAQAALAKVSGTTAQNSTTAADQASQAADNAQASVEASLESTYAALDDAVHTKADILFTNPRTLQIAFLPSFLTPDSQLQTATLAQRSALEATLAASDALTTDTSVADTDANAVAMTKNAEATEDFLNNLIQLVNEELPDQGITAATISGYQATLGAARSEVVSAVASLTTAKTTYDSDVSVASGAANTADGGSQSDIAVAQANVQSALGAVDAAKATLAKTIIRSPLSGTITDLSITDGGYVNSFTEVAEVSNPSALKVVAYVTAADAKTLAQGNAATIDGTTPGVIAQVASAIDPETATIEVDVALTGDQGDLIDGDSVPVELDRTPASSAAAKLDGQQVIPIVALKITPTGPVVFTVNAASMTLKSHPVTIGSILGQNIVVTAGLTPDMQIVTDARGLTDGEPVTVKKS